MDNISKNHIKIGLMISIGMILIIAFTKHCSIPSSSPPPPPPPPPLDMKVSDIGVADGGICDHEGVMRILAQLRRQCQNGICDINKLLNEANSLNAHSFITLIKQAESKVCYFYRSNKVDIDQVQWDEKKDILLSNLTSNIRNRKNTVAFIIAKASQKGKKEANRILSSKRSANMFTALEELLNDHNEKMQCDTIYRTYVGAELFKIHPEILPADCLFPMDKQDAQANGEALVDYVNQSVLVFTYPCFKEMCLYMKEGLNIPCSEIPDECKEFNHCQ